MVPKVGWSDQLPLYGHVMWTYGGACDRQRWRSVAQQ
jgi:hypothetical protein